MNIQLHTYHAIGFLVVVFVLTSCDSNSSSSGENVSVADANAAEFYAKGKSYIDLKSWGSAIDRFTQAIDSDPQFTEAFYYRGFAKFKTRDYSGAINDFTQCLEIEQPEYEDAFWLRGKAKYFLGDYTGAILDADKAIKLRPELTPGVYKYQLRGASNFALKRYKLAIQDLSKAIAFRSDDLRSLRTRGFSYFELMRMLPRNRNYLADRDELKVLACKDWRLAGDYGDEASLDALVKHCQ